MPSSLKRPRRILKVLRHLAKPWSPAIYSAFLESNAFDGSASDIGRRKTYGNASFEVSFYN